MSGWQYKAVPLNSMRNVAADPNSKARGIALPLFDFAAQMELTINDMSADGWEFVQSQSYTDAFYVLIFRKPGIIGKAYTDR